jgi:pyridoxal phosphate enzyme (YggS family)
MNEQERAIITQNIENVLNRITQAASRSGRESEDVTLIAVSKSQSIEKIRHAYSIGLREFGENRVYEALPKQDELLDLSSINWHMIGHIQSRKARDVPAHFSLIHSIDRLKIARKLDQYSGEEGLKLNVLLECNVSGEVTKEGWNLVDDSSWSSVLPIFKEIAAFQNLRVCGLMTMAPFGAEEDSLRKVFRRLRELREYLSDKIPGDWSELSMGMTDDFEIAIEEGATMVRIGRAIFGPREGQG